jgi:hypothetical protein
MFDTADPADVDLRIAWKRDDPGLVSDAQRFWTREGLPPGGEDSQEALGGLVVLGYSNGYVAGVTTAVISELPFLRSRFAMLNCLVAADLRRQGIARNMLIAARGVLEQWSFDHPDARVKGMASIGFADFDRVPGNRRPVYRTTGLTLAGYTQDNLLIRVCWFDHARV